MPRRNVTFRISALRSRGISLFSHNDDGTFACAGTRAVKVGEVAVAGGADAELAVRDFEGFGGADERRLEMCVSVPQRRSVTAREIRFGVLPVLDRLVMCFARILVLPLCGLIGDDLCKDGIQVIL